MQGTVKFYNDQKGYGFITPEDGSQDVFFHITQAEESYEMPQEGDVVTFDLGQGRDGRPAAQDVQFSGETAPTGGDDSLDADIDVDAEEEEEAEEESEEDED